MGIFNLSYCKELKQLVEQKRSSITTGKELFADPTFLELLNLKASIENQVFYNRKNYYFSLIQKYLNEKISSNVFQAEFVTMVKEDQKKYQEIRDNFEKLSTF